MIFLVFIYIYLVVYMTDFTLEYETPFSAGFQSTAVTNYETS
jgi:hypothetical protein